MRSRSSGRSLKKICSCSVFVAVDTTTRRPDSSAGTR